MKPDVGLGRAERSTSDLRADAGGPMKERRAQTATQTRTEPHQTTKKPPDPERPAAAGADSATDLHRDEHTHEAGLVSCRYISLGLQELLFETMHLVIIALGEDC